jgi:hypothetical protein
MAVIGQLTGGRYETSSRVTGVVGLGLRLEAVSVMYLFDTSYT